MEIERKFLVREPPPDLAELASDHIDQGYVALDGDTVEVRVRRRGRNAVLTIKQGSGLVRLEEEIAIGRQRFDRLWPLTDGRRIEKVRHVLTHDDAVVEVDVYGGELAGLMVAEVEFDSAAAASAFRPPAWFGEEITGDSRYANRNLACDGIPDDPAAFRLAPGEPASAGLRRITRGRLDTAVGRLDASDADGLGEAVHSARKDLKRLRAVVRLARDEIGDDTYRSENAALRDAGRRLSGARDSQVMVEMLDGLTERYGDELPDGPFTAFRDGLLAEHRAAQRELRAGAGTVSTVVDELRTVRGRTASWSLEAEPVDALTPGFDRIYRSGRKAMRAALEDPGDETLHELRKRVKDLWYTAELLRPAEPKRTRRLAGRARKLSDLIGEDHDLAVLEETAERHADRLTVADRELLSALIARRRARLQGRALKSARRLYARKPRKAARHIGLRAR